VAAALAFVVALEDGQADQAHILEKLLADSQAEKHIQYVQADQVVVLISPAAA
jgi:hypothetical protein